MTAQNVVDLGLKNFPQFAENYQTYQTILTFIRNRYSQPRSGYFTTISYELPSQWY